MLLERAPRTFSLRSLATANAVGEIRVESAESTSELEIELSIIEQDNKISVLECKPGTRFPACCPERHINPDGSFCLGLNVNLAEVTASTIEDWWLLLEEYLYVQLIVDQTGRWPSHKMLSHGAAGETHAKALVVASRLGVELDYEEYLSGREGWVSELVTDYLHNEERCTRKSIPVIRMSDRLMTSAEARLLQRIGGKVKVKKRKRRRLLHRLVTLEVLRVRQERKFWDAIANQGVECCGTMIDCPLQAMHRKRELERSVRRALGGSPDRA